MYYSCNLLKMGITKLSLSNTVIFMMDVIALIAVQVIQGTALNCYIILGFPGYFTPYFLFVLDIMCVFTFIFTFINAYNYFHEQAKAYHLNNDVHTHNAACKDDVKKGILPLSYLSWVFYVLIVIFKLAIIFTYGSIGENPKEAKFGPQILQVIICMSAIVFLLIVEAHNTNCEDNEFLPNLSEICKKTGIEIFDSVDIIAILMLGDDLSKGLESFIFILASINFILPTISLYLLSANHFGLIYKKCYGLKLLLVVSKLVLIDVPFFTVRGYLWFFLKNDFSILLMKNAFHILVTLRQMHKDLILFCYQSDKKVKFDAIPMDDTTQQIGNGTVNVHV